MKLQWKSCFTCLFLTVVFGAASATSAWAVTTPSIAGISVQCSQEDSTTFTVLVKFDPYAASLVFEFRNVSTGQVMTYHRMMGMANLFPLPAGTYDLTVKQDNGQGSQSLWPHITVPATALTPGQGTGCRFLKPGEIVTTMAKPRS